MTRPNAVFLGRDAPLLREMLDFYAPARQAVLDCTANHRRMWKGTDTARVTFLDIDPTMNPDVVGDFRAMPFADAAFDVLVFDPPHLPAAAGSPASLAHFRHNHGLGTAPHADNVNSLFRPFLSEAQRVLRPGGILLAKLKDYVHNHRYQWTLTAWVQAVEATPGLTPCDLRIKVDPCAGNLKSGRWQAAHHARANHAWWVVVRKGRCEPRCP